MLGSVQLLRCRLIGEEAVFLLDFGIVVAVFSRCWVSFVRPKVFNKLSIHS